MLYAIIGLLLLLADQFLKFWTVAHIELNADPGRVLIPGVLNLTYIKNTGIAFGLFGDVPALRWVLLALLIAFAAFIVIGLITRYLRTGLARWSGALLLTGLVGNGADRAVYGFVVDMLEPELGSFRWPIFNIADCLVVIFGILFCVALLTGGIGAPKKKKKRSGGGKGAPARRTSGPARSGKSAPRGGQKRSRPAEGGHPRPRPTSQEAAAAVRESTSSTLRQAEEVRSAVKSEPAPVQTVARPRPAAEPVEAAEPAVPAPAPEVKAEAPVSAPAPEVKEEITVPVAPAPRPKAPPADDFDLDDILAEFK